MNIYGWIFMLTSVSFVWALAIYCYYRVLSYAEPPAEEVQHFHSA